MNAPFPFGFPLPTAFYLVLYVVTLVIHVVFMNYVIAGTGYLALTSLAGKCDNDSGTLRGVLRDWMPFALSAAITAGVAPLLFIQILYKQRFYTANLLLFNRWMAILPVLIVGFYMLYLLKAKAVGKWPLWLRSGVGVLAFGCFAFVAYSWTENHLLSVKSPDVWGDFYGQQRVNHFEPALIPRLGIWFIGAVPTMAVMVLWQLWFAQRQGQTVDSRQVRIASTGAILGLIGAGLSAVVYYILDRANVGAAATSAMAMPYLLAAGVGLFIQALGWLLQLKAGSLHTRWLVLISVGVGLTIVGMTVVREAIRLASIDISTLYDLHADATRVGGLIVFLLFFAINAGLIAWVFVLVRRGSKHEAITSR